MTLRSGSRKNGFATCAWPLILFVALTTARPASLPQQKKPAAKPPIPPAQAGNELSKLRDEYIKATKEYKASLERLWFFTRRARAKPSQRAVQSQKLLADGLISKREVEKSDSALAEVNLKVSGAKQQIATLTPTSRKP